MRPNLVQTSKFLSYILRHNPDAIGLSLDPGGWAKVSKLLALASQHGSPLTFQELEQTVNQNDKQRFTFNRDQTKIRANQGHSFAVNLDLQPQHPPEILYHGTALRFIASIKAQGLISGDRQYVHLSSDIKTAITVGQRHGQPVIIEVLAGEMYRHQHLFYVSKNGVWLTRSVPLAYLKFSDNQTQP